MIELGDIVRINKLLSNLGICSRKEAARYIEDGRVKVNGILSIPGQWVEESDEILIDDEPVSAREKIYIALNKPVGITCTAEKTVPCAWGLDRRKNHIKCRNKRFLILVKGYI